MGSSGNRSSVKSQKAGHDNSLRGNRCRCERAGLVPMSLLLVRTENEPSNARGVASRVAARVAFPWLKVVGPKPYWPYRLRRPCHTAEMAVMETLWQMHTLTLINSCCGLLTLGAHAQRGLLYLVCVSGCVCVCPSVCVHLFSPYRDQAGSSAIPTALAQVHLRTGSSNTRAAVFWLP